MTTKKPTRKQKEKEHPFFCYKKNCRKTAWDTPEYLTQADYNFIQGLIPFLKTEDKQGCMNYLYPMGEKWTNTVAFFDRVMGWPEGYGYCSHVDIYCKDMADTYFYKMGFYAIAKYLDKLQEALDKNIKK